MKGATAIEEAILKATPHTISPDRTVSSGTSGPGGPSPILASGQLVARPENATGTSGPGGPECPAATMGVLRLPAVGGYIVNKNGVFDDNHNQITHTPVGVLALCRDGNQQNWGAFLQWEDSDGKPHQAAYPVGRFHELGTSLPAELANNGLSIVPGREKQLLQYLAHCKPTTRYRSAIQTGWQGSENVFVLPGEVIGGEIGGEIVVYQPQRYSPTARSVRAEGTLAKWQDEIALQCAGNPILVFWILAALAAPLLRLINLEGGGFHLFGITSKGKTTAQQVAATVWGDGSDPADGRGCTFTSKWNVTKNAIEGLAEAHNDLPICLDEIGEADPRTLGQTIYQLAGGKGKERMNADASLKEAKAWRTLILSTGEAPISDILQQEAKPIKGGQAVRMLDIPAEHPTSEDGVIVDSNDVAAAALADRLKRNCSKYFGTAGPTFLRAILAEGVDTVREDLATASDEIARQYTPPGASSEVMRAMKRLGLVAAAGIKAAELRIVPWSPNTWLVALLISTAGRHRRYWTVLAIKTKALSILRRKDLGRRAMAET